MPGIELSKEKTAQFFGVDTRTIDRWRNSGCGATKNSRGHWIFNSAEVSCWLKNRERESALGELAAIDESEARRRKLAAEAAREELKLATEEGKVVAIADYEKEGLLVTGAFRAKALNFASKMAPLVMQAETVAEAKCILDSGIRELLNEMSNLDGILSEHPQSTGKPAGGESQDSENPGSSTGSNGKRMGRSRKKA